MQPQNPIDPNTQPQAAPQPPVQPAFQPMPAAPQPAPVSMPYSAQDPGKQMSLIGLIVGIFIPVVGIPLAVMGRSKSKTAGYDGKLGLIGIIVGAVSAVVAVIVALTLPALLTKSIVTSFPTGDGGTSTLNIEKSSTSAEAFGVKVGMSRSDVENVLGKPEAPSKYIQACQPTDQQYVSTLGYDTTCAYQVGKAKSGSYIIPNISVKYLNDTLVEATKTTADGSLTTLNKDGVTDVKSNQ